MIAQLDASITAECCDCGKEMTIPVNMEGYEGFSNREFRIACNHCYDKRRAAERFEKTESSWVHLSQNE